MIGRIVLFRNMIAGVAMLAAFVFALLVMPVLGVVL